MSLRRLLATFALVLNTAALVLAVLTLGNASSLPDLAGSEDVTGDLLVIARSDATLVITLAILGIAGNLLLGYLLVSGGLHGERGRDVESRPRITGE